jgi:hypothetical protein
MAAAAALLAACVPVPANRADLGPDSASTVEAGSGDGASAGIIISLDHPFGQEGELPSHLQPGVAGELWALTQRAIYRLDDQGRARTRTALPAASSGATAMVHTARWDGSNLGLTLRWGSDKTVPAGTYLALAGSTGVITPSSMISLTSAGNTARGDWDGSAHLVLWTQPSGGKLDLHVTRVPPTGPKDTRKLASGLPAGTTLGGWVSRADLVQALCTVDPDGGVSLRRYTNHTPMAVVRFVDPGHSAVGTCKLATSGRSFLVAYVHKALPPGRVDARPGAPDLGPGSIAYDVPVVQVVDPAGKALQAPLRLSLAYEGTVRVEQALWDGARYVVLLNTVGYKGGRAVLTALDETGHLLARDRVIPLNYEPSRLEGARLLAAGPDYALLYAARRPWDSGVLHLARFSVSRW